MQEIQFEAIGLGKKKNSTDESYVWLCRYVNCPIRKEDENLIAVQFNGELYYQTKRDVKAGEEVRQDQCLVLNRSLLTSLYSCLCITVKSKTFRLDLF